MPGHLFPPGYVKITVKLSIPRQVEEIPIHVYSSCANKSLIKRPTPMASLFFFKYRNLTKSKSITVILGYVGWGAGNFLTNYVLSETPTNNGGSWTDSLLVEKCLAPISGAQNGSF